MRGHWQLRTCANFVIAAHLGRALAEVRVVCARLNARRAVLSFGSLYRPKNVVRAVLYGAATTGLPRLSGTMALHTCGGALPAVFQQLELDSGPPIRGGYVLATAQ